MLNAVNFYKKFHYKNKKSGGKNIGVDIKDKKWQFPYQDFKNFNQYIFDGDCP